MEPQEVGIIAVCRSVADRRHLATIRSTWPPDGEGVSFQPIPNCVRFRPVVDEETDLDSATDRALEAPGRNILLTLGYPEREIRRHFEPIRAPLQVVGRSTNLPMSDDDNGERRKIERLPSASLLGDAPSSPSIIFGRDPLSAIRKATIRNWIRQNIKVRRLREADLDAYFSLRHRIWSDLNYIEEDRRCGKSQWEVDYTDRCSIPVGAFIRDDRTGRQNLVACGRIVRGIGLDEPHYRKMIERSIRAKSQEVDEPRLVKNFEYPTEMSQSFDILDSFPEFWRYYAELVRRNVSRAELSRIIVEPGYRKQSIGEVIVDSLVELAASKRLHVLLLACIRKHQSFYQRCGFSVVPELTCEKFVNVNVPAIVMRRDLTTL